VAKPIPSHVEYDLGVALGRIVVNKELTVYGDSANEQAHISLEEGLEDTVAVLLNVAKYLLDRIGDPKVTERLLKEASLGGFSLGRAPNEGNEGLMNERMNERKGGVSKTPTEIDQHKDQTLSFLSEARFSSDEIRYLSAQSGIRSTILRSSNPPKAARTILDKEKHQKMFPAWLKKNPPAGAAPLELKCRVCDAELEAASVAPEDYDVDGKLTCADCLHDECGPDCPAGDEQVIVSSKAFAVEEDLEV
jgi:hypothetical protein